MRGRTQGSPSLRAHDDFRVDVRGRATAAETVLASLEAEQVGGYLLREGCKVADHWSEAHLWRVGRALSEHLPSAEQRAAAHLCGKLARPAARGFQIRASRSGRRKRTMQEP